MAIHLNLTNLDKTGEKSARLHWMPCQIKVNGEANVSTYFEPAIDTIKDGVLKASFRGYPLLGRELNIPENYCGLVVQEMKENLGEERERNLYKTHEFNKLTYWNWDIEPSGNDKIAMALDWLDIAKALHSPVDS